MLDQKHFREIFLKKVSEKIDDNNPIIKQKIGTDYGGWILPLNFMSRNITAICVGAGEDITFDCQLVQLFDANVHILDPTDRAERHFNSLLNRNLNKLPIDFINSQEMKKMYLIGDACSKLKFHKIGLFDKNGKVNFFPPKDVKHVSFSAENIQNTKDPISLDVVKYSTLISNLSLKKLDLLKLDIEGSEHRVLNNIFSEKGIFPKILCIEFDYFWSLNQKNLDMIIETIDLILANQYILYAVEKANVCFLKK